MISGRNQLERRLEGKSFVHKAVPAVDSECACVPAINLSQVTRRGSDWTKRGRALAGPSGLYESDSLYGTKSNVLDGQWLVVHLKRRPVPISQLVAR